MRSNLVLLAVVAVVATALCIGVLRFGNAPATPVATPSSPAAGGTKVIMQPPNVTADSRFIRAQFQPPDMARVESGDICVAEGAAVPRRGASPPHSAALPPLPRKCPPFVLVANSTADTVQDRRSDWVAAKYRLYAQRCERRGGLMWAALSATAHDRIAVKVARLLLEGTAEAAIEDNTTTPGRLRAKAGPAWRLLDWGSGCGAGMRYFAQYLSPDAPSPTSPLRAIGVDLTAEAISYANTVVTPQIAPLFPSTATAPLFCHADGTDLGWIATGSFDAVTAFGALLHLPSAFACRAVQELVRVTRVGGTIWGGYIDDRGTVALLSACRVPCRPGVRVELTVVDERRWFGRVGMPRNNLRRRPSSLVWRLLPAGP